MLEQVFEMAASDDIEIRKKIPPIFVFESAQGRDMKFLGLVAPGIKWRPKKDWLIAVWGSNTNGDRFQNYKALFTVIDTAAGSLASPDAGINLGWINDIKNGKTYESEYAPLEWKKFIDGKNYRALICKLVSAVKSKAEQLPSDENGKKMLKTIHDYFIEEDNGYSFEPFACDIARQMDTRIASLDVTGHYRDHGFDGVGKYVGFALLVLLSVLLGCQYHLLCSSHFVYPVNHLVQRLQLLKPFGVDVKEIELDWRSRSNAHHNYTGLLILISFLENAI